MNYVDLAVQISPGGDGRFEVRVASCEGEGKSQMILPFALSDLVGVVHGLHPDAPPDAAAPAPLQPPAPPPPPAPASVAVRMGSQLFDALFQGEGRDILSRTEGVARSNGDTGVRLRLTMDLRDLGVCEAAALPWELMCRDDGSPIAVSTSTAVVRAIDTPLPVTPRPLTGPLRILALRSNPQGTVQLDLQAEVDAVSASWAGLPGVEVEFARPTQAAILDALARSEHHVIHYMGHGGFDPVSTGGRLLLENDDGSLRRVDGETFAQWVADSPLRLVFLNACETGRTPGRAEVPPFAGIAAALIRAGVPAVIGNQFSVSDNGAITFARTFYARIAEGFPVDEAATLARKAIYDSALMPVQWATPVLYMRSHDGDLFPRAAAAAPTLPAVAAAQTQIQPQPEPIQAMSDSSNRSISIGGAVDGSVVQTGDHNVTTLTSTTLPPPESVDMNEVMRELRDLVAKAQLPPDSREGLRINNALDEVDAEVKSPAPNKGDAADSLNRAVGTMKEMTQFAGQMAQLAPLVLKAGAWLGVHVAAPLLATVGLAV